MSDPIADQVVSILAKVKRMPREQITPDSTLTQIGLDSLDVINAVFDLESSFRISIPDEAVQSVRTVRDIVEGVRKAIGERTDTQVA